MISAQLILLVLALVCFVVAMLKIEAPRINVLALGFVFWILSLLFRAT